MSFAREFGLVLLLAILIAGGLSGTEVHMDEESPT
jgi:hypothetical protein